MWVCRGALSPELRSIRAPGGRSKGRDGGRGGGEGGMGAFFLPSGSLYLDLKKRAGLEEVRPAIRVRIDQCREKKCYINIYYVDKSVDKSSLSRALSLSLLFPSSHPQPARAAPNLRPPARHLPPPELPGEDGSGERLGSVGGTGRRDSGPDPRPSPPAKAGGGYSVPDGLPAPKRGGWTGRRLAGGR